MTWLVKAFEYLHDIEHMQLDDEFCDRMMENRDALLLLLQTLGDHSFLYVPKSKTSKKLPSATTIDEGLTNMGYVEKDGKGFSLLKSWWTILRAEEEDEAWSRDAHFGFDQRDLLSCLALLILVRVSTCTF